MEKKGDEYVEEEETVQGVKKVTLDSWSAAIETDTDIYGEEREPVLGFYLSGHVPIDERPERVAKRTVYRW